jgi:hypothetical protein
MPIYCRIANRSLFQYGWSTRVHWRHDGIDEIVVLGGEFKPDQRLIAYNISDGAERRWLFLAAPTLSWKSWNRWRKRTLPMPRAAFVALFYLWVPQLYGEKASAAANGGEAAGNGFRESNLDERADAGRAARELRTPARRLIAAGNTVEFQHAGRRIYRRYDTGRPNRSPASETAGFCRVPKKSLVSCPNDLRGKS